MTFNMLTVRIVVSGYVKMKPLTTSTPLFTVSTTIAGIVIPTVFGIA